MLEERERAKLHQRYATLSAREREVLERVIRGQTNKVIASDLGIVEKTVEAHRARVMLKMGARNLVELIKFTSLSQEDKGTSL